MKKLFIIKTGITFDDTKMHYGDFDKWVIDKLDNDSLQTVVIDMHQQFNLPFINECAGVIITGSHSMVTDEEPWSVAIEKWIPLLIKNEIPILAICYGHQLLAKSLDGISSYHENGMEIGTVEISLTDEAKDDELFKDLPNNFNVHTIHSQTVKKLPSNAVRLAFNNHDKNHSFRVGKKAWSVQFHPEYDNNIMRSYINEVSKTKKLSTKKLINNIKQTSESNFILKKFAQIVQKEVNND
ncbi:glutamine amidotransferase [Arcobacter sp. CECT 8985]|uniref:glutamine amidotransferase n=1 Tax=Arcobacter sp. CECT 8985 TaxID=1935424 RepID=UPI00100B0F90|nr:glutamine amidotransferase [Arcobacter sp. CECT 8985]RXJ88147.1 GMP synthase [Arcobacter sp. CECT 8985]